MVVHRAAYDEIAEFIADMAPQKLAEYHASPSLQDRVEYLLDKNQEDGLSESERSELEHYLLIDHLISLAKIRAYKILNKSLN